MAWKIIFMLLFYLNPKKASHKMIVLCMFPVNFDLR